MTISWIHNAQSQVWINFAKMVIGSKEKFQVVLNEFLVCHYKLPLEKGINI